eukprot:TRINITY_DN47100_c0_g1_i1.p2 TRINITY_DN47100_c0_g1~~TRINITY_DN47100_c0_g1_i1.p2  ORF type:complete len:414 (-),score=114.66 TRINITY_DN47100_c0_g1_i1:84-1325(-)
MAVVWRGNRGLGLPAALLAPALLLLLLPLAFLAPASAALDANSAAAAAAEVGECDAGGSDGEGCRRDVAALKEGLNNSGNASLEEDNATAKSEASKKHQWWRIALVLSMFVPVLVWIIVVIKFACDGSLPARLALWGLLPEVCAAVSVHSIIALLRLKTHAPTTAIVLRSCVTDDGAEQLADALREYGARAELEVIELAQNPKLGCRGLEALAQAIGADGSRVAELDLSFNPQLGDAAVPILRKSIESKASKLQVLRLAACNLTLEGLRPLAQLGSASKLRALDLSRNELKGAGELLSTICEAPVLEELVLAWCSLGVDDVRELAESLQFTGIRTLQLGGNGFGSAGLLALSEHLPETMVDELGLEANDIETSALSELGAAWAKRPFARVSLRGNRMSNEELQSFVRTLKSCV